VKSLGADVLYLNPIHLACTNHKYDALDYRQISPEYGTHAAFRRLADDVHAAGMKLVLDGVFNHMGRTRRASRTRSPTPPARGAAGSRSARSTGAGHACGRASRTAVMGFNLRLVLLAAPGSAPVTTIGSGFVTVTVQARSALVLAPRERDLGGYSRCKGVPWMTQP